MSKPVKSNLRRPLSRGKRQRQSPVILLLIMILWSICLGWGLSLIAGASEQPIRPAQEVSAVPGTVDIVPERYQLGKTLYLENCGSCHLALPPEVMPTETWRQLLMALQQHYGQQLEPIDSPSLLVMWNYLQTFSRPLGRDEPTPYRLNQSRYFKALHPGVELPADIKPISCVSCHPSAAQYDYRSLSSQWQE